MNAQKLDRKRSYGIVYGDPSIGFFQDELPYKHDGTLHPSAAAPNPPQTAPASPPVTPPTADQFPTADTLPETIEASQVKPEIPKPDPARSEMMRKIWAERRAREAAQSVAPPIGPA